MGRPIDPSSLRQRKIRGELVARVDGDVARDRDFEFLETIATFNEGGDHPAPIAKLAKAYSCSRQAVHARAKRLRERGWLEPGEGRHVCGLRLTHNGKLLVETGLGAGLKE